MLTRAHALAERYERANQELIATAESCSDAQWQAPCAVEGWPVGVTAHHVGVMAALAAELLAATIKGKPWPSITWDAIHHGNAQHAHDHAGCTRDETVAMLQRNGAAVRKLIEGLRDTQLDHAPPASWREGAPLSVEQFVVDHLIGHIQEHLPSIRAALGA